MAGRSIIHYPIQKPFDVLCAQSLKDKQILAKGGVKDKTVRVLFITTIEDREYRTVFEVRNHDGVIGVAVMATEHPKLGTAKGLYLPYESLHTARFEVEEGVSSKNAEILFGWWRFLKEVCDEELIAHQVAMWDTEYRDHGAPQLGLSQAPNALLELTRH